MNARVTVRINGEAFAAEPGASVASLVHAARRSFRQSPRLKGSRGLFCGMGVCFECLVSVDGQPVRACITPVREGMSVEVQP